jgi:hypothetical protein
MREAVDKSQEAGRSDAVQVYAWLRAVAREGGATAEEIAFQCFPSASEGPASSIVALRKRGITKVFSAIVWLRASGVTVRAVPDVSGVGLTRYVVGGS